MPIEDDGQPLLFDRIISTKFLPVTDIPNTARVRLILCNGSKRPIIYKLKCETKALITAVLLFCFPFLFPEFQLEAEPRASGTIPALGVSSCLLIWRRAPNVTNWKDVNSTSMIMITEFEGSDDPNINEHTVTKIKCRISSSAVCDSEKPPEEYVTFKSSFDLVLPRSSAAESRVITPITGLERSSSASQMASKNAMTVNKRSSSISASENSATYIYTEAKGVIIIALIIIIFILCIQVLLETKSEVE